MSDKVVEGVKASAVGTIAGGAVVGGTCVAQVAAGTAVPTLMSVGATVVPGVGSIMPWWIGPIQAFAAAGTLSVAAVPAVAVGGTVATAYALYKWNKS